MAQGEHFSTIDQGFEHDPQLFHQVTVNGREGGFATLEVTSQLLQNMLRNLLSKTFAWDRFVEICLD